MYPPREVTPWLVITVAIGLYVWVRLEELTSQKPWKWGDDHRSTYVKPVVNLIGGAIAVAIIAIGAELYCLLPCRK